MVVSDRVMFVSVQRHELLSAFPSLRPEFLIHGCFLSVSETVLYIRLTISRIASSMLDS